MTDAETDWVRMAGTAGLLAGVALYGYRTFWKQRSYMVAWTATSAEVDAQVVSGTSLYKGSYTHEEVVHLVTAEAKRRPPFAKPGVENITVEIKTIHVI